MDRLQRARNFRDHVKLMWPLACVNVANLHLTVPLQVRYEMAWEIWCYSGMSVLEDIQGIQIVLNNSPHCIKCVWLVPVVIVRKQNKIPNIVFILALDRGTIIISICSFHHCSIESCTEIRV